MSDSTRKRDTIGFAVFLAICLAVSAIGGVATASSVGTWYQTLAKPAFNPPNWIFAPVWTALYFMMAVAGWRVWRRDGLRRARWALSLFALQLVLNLSWSILFFGLRSIGAALIEIVVLLLAILATTAVFWQRDRLAGMLFIPYAGWVAFATVLNAALWRLN
ncbi:MAG: tryptophan-rich sensory protein [Burkholderiales bacterium]|nr:tryptophan-rich sensory protein [Burkholderiales bacterium]